MTNYTYAFDLDETVDDEIRKNYNPTQLIEDVGITNSALNKKIVPAQAQSFDERLPELPKIIDEQTNNQTSKNSNLHKSTVTATDSLNSTKPYLGRNIRIRKGTSFNVINNSAISDWQVRGTQIVFTNQKPIYAKKYTIPASTVFKAEIIESHRPQITCNGGLVVIKVHSMIYKGQTIPLNAYITRANDKKIFFNNIKGDRTYLKTMWKKGNWGRTIFDKMMNLTVNLGASTSTLILSPFPFAYGTLCLGANTILSPITAFFSKGGSVSIPAQSNFRIKLTEDVFVD